jgi:Protein of unknown function (DUF2844)
MTTYAEARTLFVSLRLVIAMILLGMCVPAFAALGGDLDSIEADRAQMKAQTTVTQSSNYAVHEMKSDLGTVVREYVTSDGRVFAVSWHGTSMPNMKQILGSYFQQYTAGAEAARAARPGRRPLNIQQPGLVVQNSGHIHAYTGRAYDPGLLPTGVTANAIQ